MAYTFSVIAGKVRNRIRDTSYSTEDTANFINDTVNDIFNEYRLPFMQTTQTYTVTVGDSDITHGSGLPTNFVNTIDLVNTTSGQESVIPYKDFSELDIAYPDEDDTTRNASGVPLYWYKYGNTIKLFPSPAAAYTLTLRYYKKPTVLSADGDVPDIPSEFEELLVVGAGYRILQVKDNYDQAAILENKYHELLQKLVMRYSQDQTGTVKRMPINRGRFGSRSLDTVYRRTG
jgi:hypothetical protein